MCGRFLLSTPAEVIARLFGARMDKSLSDRWLPRYNIAPSQQVLAIRAAAGGGRDGVMLRWGLIPFFSKDRSTDLRTINAKSETADSRPAFRAAFRKRRCLIPADGFYEWQARPEGGKQPMLIRAKDGKPLALAGLWEIWSKEEPAIESCTILTCPPNSLLTGIHDRMPVILEPSAWERWLDPNVEDPAEVKSLLTPMPAERMEAFAVSRRVNSPAIDDPSCAEPLAARASVPEAGLFGQVVAKPRRRRGPV